MYSRVRQCLYSYLARAGFIMQERQRADMRIKVMKQVRALAEQKARRFARENTQLLVCVCLTSTAPSLELLYFYVHAHPTMRCIVLICAPPPISSLIHSINSSLSPFTYKPTIHTSHAKVLKCASSACQHSTLSTLISHLLVRNTCSENFWEF